MASSTTRMAAQPEMSKQLRVEDALAYLDRVRSISLSSDGRVNEICRHSAVWQLLRAAEIGTIRAWRFSATVCFVVWCILLPGVCVQSAILLSVSASPLAPTMQVKTQFADQPHIYNKFLEIMKAFKAQE